MRSIEGGCACGHVRFRMTSAPIIVHGCHCRFCQRMTGSAFAVNIMIETDRLEMTSEGRAEMVPTPSALPEGQTFLRCPKCRCALWSHHSQLGETIALVNAGALDHAEVFPPDVHCYTASKHPWIGLPDDVPQFEGNYDIGVVWNAGIRARIDHARSQRT